MKKHTNILALVAVLVAFAAPAFAQGVGIKAQPRMKFSGTRLDSTQVAIPNWATGVSVIASQDTTNWFDLSGFDFAVGAVAASPLVQFQINHQIGAATDSIAYAIEWANDAADLTSFIPGTVAFVTTGTKGATVVPGCDNDDLTCARYVRVIVQNVKVASGVTRKFSIVPLLRLKQ